MKTRHVIISRTDPTRKSWAEDIAWVSSIYCQAVGEEILLNEGRRWRRVDPSKKDSISEVLKRILSEQNSGCLFLAKEGSERIGYFLGMVKECMAEEPSRIGYVNGLYVLEGFRHQGTGQALLDAGYGWFRSLDITLVEIYTAWDNEVGRKFWKKNGFLPTEMVMIAPLPAQDHTSKAS